MTAGIRVGRGLLVVDSLPAVGSAMRKRGFDLVVFCAEEYQPPAFFYPGVAVLHVPLSDTAEGLTPKQRAAARLASRQVATALAQGRRVCVTCIQGRNRSGLVAALALTRMGVPHAKAVALIRQMRAGHNALANPRFTHMLANDPVSRVA